MAWTDLPTDYTDAVWDGLKKYTQVDNSDGTVSFNDVTTYTNKEKSFFGAKDANSINEAINYIMGVIEKGSTQYAGLVYYGYDNSAVTCPTTSGSYTRAPMFTSKEDGIYSSFATLNVNVPSASTGGAVLQIEKNGLYLFDIRAQFNSHTANKRVEFCPFIDGTRDGTHSYSFCTPGDFYLTYNVQIPLRLTAGQTVYFAIAPVENVAVSAKIVDINVWALDWEGK